MRDRVQENVIRKHADENAIVVIDETSCPKKGDKTAGVQRQYCGATGKIDNCVVSVHLGYVTDPFHTLLDSDLYLAEASCADAERRRKRVHGLAFLAGDRDPAFRLAASQVPGIWPWTLVGSPRSTPAPPKNSST